MKNKSYKIKVERRPVYDHGRHHTPAYKESTKILTFTEYTNVVLLNGKCFRVDVEKLKRFIGGFKNQTVEFSSGGKRPVRYAILDVLFEIED